MPEIAVYLCLFMVIVLLVVALVGVCRVVKRQEKTISDLLDRIMAPDFHQYQAAREVKEQKVQVIKAQEFIDAMEPDGLRVE